VTTKQQIKLFQRYVIGNYARNPIVLVRGKGSYVWDAEGRRYLDMFPGWGVNALGHCPPRVVAAVRKQAGRLMHVANNYYNELQAVLAQTISKASFGGQCFFCNSGAEAVEAAIKLARIWGGEWQRIITMHNSFHGRTNMAIAATAQPKYHKGVLPAAVASFIYVPYDDVAAVEQAIAPDVCAIMVEPFQGEGGVNIPSPDYLPALRRLCDKRGLLLILDEVTTGCGRTGRYFGYQHTPGVTPDIMTMAKALGGGLAIGAIEAKPEIAKLLVPGTHAATFGGNPLACAASLATFETIREDKVLQNVRAVGGYLVRRFQQMQRRVPAIRAVRGTGVLVGVELDRNGGDLFKLCMKKGLLINCTHDTVMRFMPAMTLSRAEAEEGADIFERAFEEFLR